MGWAVGGKVSAMVKPQQPELARSGRGEVDPNAVKTRHGGPTDTTDAPGPVPEDNLPGHHPETEQDKPDVVPRAQPRGRRAPPKPEPAPTAAPAEPTKAAKTAEPTKAADPPAAPVHERFTFAFEPVMAAAALPFGVTPLTASVDVADGTLRVRFGPWSVRTPLENVEGAEITGPYALPKVIGPAHLSLKDGGLTFATTTKRGVCIRFRTPVRGIAPFGLLKHPALTVTVAEPEHLVEALRSTVAAAR